MPWHKKSASFWLLLMILGSMTICYACIQSHSDFIFDHVPGWLLLKLYVSKLKKEDSGVTTHEVKLDNL